MHYYTRDSVRDALKIIGLITGIIGLWMICCRICYADDCPRMAITSEGNLCYEEYPKTTLEDSRDLTFELSNEVCWCGETIEILSLLERALNHIPDYSQEDSVIYDNLLYLPSSPLSREADKLESMKESAKLHNEIKALIAKIKKANP